MISKYVCACVYACKCAHVCVYMCLYEYVYMCKCISIYVYMKSIAPGQNATCDFFMLDHGQLQRLIMVMPISQWVDNQCNAVLRGVAVKDSSLSRPSKLLHISLFLH